MVFLFCIIAPVKLSNSLILSTSSPKNSILIPFVFSFAGINSITSPFALKQPLLSSILFLSYNISTNFFNISSLLAVSPMFNVIVCFLYSSTSPIPYIQETDATTITSLLLIKAEVALCLNSSISSLIDASFSIKVSVLGTYASG